MGVRALFQLCAVTAVHMYENGFSSISFEKISVLVSFFIHRYIIIKYRSSSILDKICQLLRE